MKPLSSSAGSSKSTIAALLLRMCTPNSGRIDIDDQDAMYLDDEWMKENMATVSQGYPLFDGTVHENVAMGLEREVTREEVVDACMVALMHDFVRDLPEGYETRLGDGGAVLGGGQRQRHYNLNLQDRSVLAAVEVSTDTSVWRLKELILEKSKHVLKDVDAGELTLWKLKEAVPIKPASTLAERVPSKVDYIKVAVELDPADTISESFRDRPLSKNLHIIVQAPLPATDLFRQLEIPEISDGEMKEALEEAQMNLVRFARKAPASSHAAHREYLMTERYPIRNGREQRQGLPIGLYHPAFAQFLASQADKSTKILSQQYDHVIDLIAVSCKYYRNEADRFEALKGPLTKLIHSPLAISVSTGVKADGLVFTSVHDRPNACRAVCEIKNEIGEGTSDPSAQAGQAYRKYWANAEVDDLRRSCCCPSFIIAIAGPWMCVLGGVFVNAVIVQPLTEYVWLGPGSPYFNHLQNLARLFGALSDGLSSLDKFYHDLKINPPTFSRLFPCFSAYPYGEETIKFQYLFKLAEEAPTKAIFKAQIESDGPLIVVKFVERYNAVAHRLLATAGYAPSLLYASEEPTYGGLHMIVMDFLPGNSAHEEYYGYKLPPSVMDNITKAIDTLHEKGLVFGDLRTSNIMVMEGQAKLVDFDWCGEHGAGKYPVDLNMNLGWHEDVKRGGVMRKEHDKYMMLHL